ncbi:MAG: segregation/condensation protein A [Bdellovibrionales bacterium]|nr:segregation/condensation protein A [Bdellovibrionales bacterium]
MEQQLSPTIELNQYSGPLDLLLQLIQKQEMDIFHIDISQITNQYLCYLNKVSVPDLENAGEFIRMAVLLMYIKSKTLLPEQPKEEEEEPSPEELKKQLTRLLVKYQIFQKAGEFLYDRTLLGRDLWVSGFKENKKSVPNDEIEVKTEEAPLLFMKNCRKMLTSERKKQPISAPSPLPSLMDRIQDLMEVLAPHQSYPFSHLTAVKKRKHSRLLTFLSLLELSKLELVSLFQKKPFLDILVTVKKQLDNSVLEELEQNEDQDTYIPQREQQIQ